MINVLIFSSYKSSGLVQNHNVNGKMGGKRHYEPPKKRRKRYHEEQPKITKETLLKALKDAEDEINRFGNQTLQPRLQELRRQVEGVLSNKEKEMKDLYDKIVKLQQDNKNLKKRVEKLRAKNKRMEKTLAVAQATWVWEKHVARFVIDPSEKFYKSDWIEQMEKFLKKIEKKKDVKQNRWKKIQDKLKTWTQEHWVGIRCVRNERNAVAHPDLIDLDLVKSELKNMFPKRRKQMKDMLEQLKMTASLMKFGRLTKYYCAKHQSFVLEGKKKRKDALVDIISWDRKFEDIDGLQNIKHDEAKNYLAKYVDPTMVSYYDDIVDHIKERNGKCLSKLARNIAKHYGPEEGSKKSKALRALQDLHDRSRRDERIKDLPCDIAKLHIPDFLEKHLWKAGIKIVEDYFN